jgi:hypothetical protein
MLAGDVLVNVVDGTLVIEGDAEGNQIEITAGDEEGTYIVTGLNGTTVHETGVAAAAEVTVMGVEEGVEIDLGDGDDSVSLTELSLHGRVSIETGAGNDVVNLTGGEDTPANGEEGEDQAASVDIRGSLRINTGDDNDEVNIDDASLRGSLRIDTGDGDDTVSIGSELVDEPVVETALARFGNGNGLGRFFRGFGGFGFGGLFGEDIDATVSIRGGAHVELGEGNDTLDMNNVSVRSHMTVNGAEGDDDITLNVIQTNGLTILGDDGIDTIALAQVQAKHLGIFAGDGNDEVSVVDSAFFSLGVMLGDGDDTLTTDTLEAKLAFLLGGDGEDTHNVAGESEFRHEFIRGFELPVEPAPLVNSLLRRR